MIARTRLAAWFSTLVFVSSCLPLAAGALSPADFGAVLDGVTNDGPALQRAIDAAHAAGGGTVAIPAGRRMLSGSFELKARVTLHLEPGSRLLASTVQADYRNAVFIEAFHAEDIAITGTGTIDGQGIQFMAEELPHIFRPKPWRPKLIIFENCRRVKFHDLTIRDSPNWTIHLAGCDDVVVHGVTILNNLKIPNCDGIDPDHSRNVRISDCHIEAGDDCIVLKNRREYAAYGPCENITVTNCTLVSTSAALKIGTETVDDVRNVVFSNCVIRNSHRGIAIVLRDEGSIENILIQNIVIETRLFDEAWWGAAEPIYVSARPRTPNGKIGRIRGVRFDQIRAHSEGGVFLSGSPESPLTDIRLDRVSVRLHQRTEWPRGRIDVRPPDHDRPTHAQLAGFRIRHAQNVSVTDSELEWSLPKPEGGMLVDRGPGVSDLRTERVSERVSTLD